MSSLHCAMPSLTTESIVGWFPKATSATAAQPSSIRGSSTHAGRMAVCTLPPPDLVRHCGFRRGNQLVADEQAETFNRQLVESAGDNASSARMARLFTMLDDNHPADVCWHLAFMGVDPSAQGQGIGTRLLSAVLTQADRDQVPAYLEASCPENRRLYERHGFQTMRELTVADSPVIYAMWRTPADLR
jgi:GNAT superfamily N-acetyltransferase